MQDDDQEHCTTAAQLAATQTLVERLTQQQQRADIQLAQQQAQLLQKDQHTVALNLRIADLEGQVCNTHLSPSLPHMVTSTARDDSAFLGHPKLAHCCSVSSLRFM